MPGTHAQRYIIDRNDDLVQVIGSPWCEPPGPPPIRDHACLSAYARERLTEFQRPG